MYKAALALVIVGALNWLFVGLFHFDLVAAIFGNMSVLARAVYILVGLAGLVCLGIFSKRLDTGRVAYSDNNTRDDVRRVA